MALPPHRDPHSGPRPDPDPELEDIRELGLIERQHRRAAQTLGVSHGAMGLVWALAVAVLLAAIITLFLVTR